MADDDELSVDTLDVVAERLGSKADELAVDVEAGTARVVGSLEPLLDAVETMRDRGVEARALPDDDNTRLAYKNSIMAVATASAGAVYGEDSDQYREASGIAWDIALGRKR